MHRSQVRRLHVFAKVPAVGFSATGAFSCSAFGLGGHVPSKMAGDEIAVTIDGDFIQAASPSTTGT